MLLDLGVSSPQLDDAARGFSFAQDGPLDMRMDTAAGASAADFLARAPEHELARVIREYGEEKFAKRIARDIVAARREGPIDAHRRSSREIVARAVRTREPGKHPATRTFQAIRIHVNDELGELEAALDGSLEVLAPGGRLCAITFHSLEDGLVKRFMQQHSQDDPVYAGLPQIPPHARAEAATHRPRRASVGGGSRRQSARTQCRAARRREGCSMSIAMRAGVVVLALGAALATGDRRRLDQARGAQPVHSAAGTERRARRARDRVGPAEARAERLGDARPRRADRARRPAHGDSASRRSPHRASRRPVTP